MYNKYAERQHKALSYGRNKALTLVSLVSGLNDCEVVKPLSKKRSGFK